MALGPFPDGAPGCGKSTMSIRTLEAGAVGRKAMLGPKATLMDYMFHTLEPPWIIGVVIWEIK